MPLQEGICEWCRGRGVYAHENPATGGRNAIDCPRCKGTGRNLRPRPVRADDYA